MGKGQLVRVKVLAVAAVAALAGGVVIGSVAATSVARASSVQGSDSAHAVTQKFTRDGHFVIPAGVDTITVTVTGGGGGAAHDLYEARSLGGQEQTYPGQPGGQVQATIAVASLSGRTLDVVVGAAGHDGLVDTGAGGTGFGVGGDGGVDGSGLHGENVLGAGGGGGGGASAVLSGTTPLVVAGGGGGGGGAPILALGSPLNYVGGSCTWLVDPTRWLRCRVPFPPTTSTPPVTPPPACTQPSAPTGPDGGDGSDSGRNGPLLISTGGGGGGGFLGGAGGRSSAQGTAFCIGDGDPGVDHVAAAGVSAVTESTAGTGGVDGSVTISYEDPGSTVSGAKLTSASTSTTSTTIAEPSTEPPAPTPASSPAPAAALTRTPRYTG